MTGMRRLEDSQESHYKASSMSVRMPLRANVLLMFVARE